MKKKKPKHRPKKQFTVRIDEELMKNAWPLAEAEDMSLNELMEAGMWRWLQRPKEPEVTIRGRAMWNHIPQRIQEETVAFWAYMTHSNPTPFDEKLRRFITEVLSDHNYDEVEKLYGFESPIRRDTEKPKP